MLARTRFLGASASVSQEPLAARAAQAAAGVDTTGRVVWECCNVLLRWLERRGSLARLLSGGGGGGGDSGGGGGGGDGGGGGSGEDGEDGKDGGDARALLRSLHVVDLSAGAGLVALALASAGAALVTATDTPAQLPLLRSNLAPAAANARVLELLWGEDVAPLAAARGASDTGALAAASDAAAGGASAFPPPPPRLCVCSDILYIALRDGLSRQLSWTLRALAASMPLLFAFEERLISEETAFMLALSEPLEAAPGPEGAGDGAGAGASAAAPLWRGAARALHVEELPSCELRLDKSEALEREDGGEACSTDLFWESPPVRAFILRGRGHG